MSMRTEIKGPSEEGKFQVLMNLSDVRVSIFVVSKRQ